MYAFLARASRIILSASLLSGGALPALALPAGAGTLSAHDTAREVRAVWITTVGGLDWPQSTNTAVQKASLTRILESLRAARFNTIFFQVRGRGDVLYPSSMEPWAASLTGTPGSDPGWDPLEFVIEGAHERGMEVHAWFNTYFVRGTATEPAVTNPPHVITAHPGWVRRHGDEWWIDPGNRDARDYLVKLAGELVSAYDIDGLQMDYIRYPGRGFNDSATFAREGGGMERDGWRRENVTLLLRGIREMIDSVKPWVKMGCTPLGIYRNPDGVRGLESYTDVFQDSYAWVREGIVDYLAPQVYWPLGGRNGDPDFAVLAAEWRRQTHGRHLYLGIGSYKPEVERQTRSLMGISRESGAEGMAFFRYASIEPLLADTLFTSRALPPAMPWKDSASPPPAGRMVVLADGPGVRKISWSPPAVPPGEGGPLFAGLYRVRDGNSPARRVELVGIYRSDAASVRDTIPGGDQDDVAYVVASLSRSGVESVPEGGIAAPEAAAGERRWTGPVELRLGVPFAPSGREVLFVPLYIAGYSPVTLTILDTSRAELLRASEGVNGPGDHVISLDISSLRPGRYSCRVRAGGLTSEKSFTVPD